MVNLGFIDRAICGGIRTVPSHMCGIPGGIGHVHGVDHVSYFEVWEKKMSITKHLLAEPPCTFRSTTVGWTGLLWTQSY